MLCGQYRQQRILDIYLQPVYTVLLSTIPSYCKQNQHSVSHKHLFGTNFVHILHQLLILILNFNYISNMTVVLVWLLNKANILLLLFSHYDTDKRVSRFHKWNIGLSLMLT